MGDFLIMYVPDVIFFFWEGGGAERVSFPFPTHFSLHSTFPSRKRYAIVVYSVIIYSFFLFFLLADSCFQCI